MCFLNEYTCTVRCLNTELNVSQAMNGTIQSLRPAGDQCRVMACQFVGEIGDGPGLVESGLTLNNFWPTFGMVVGLALIVIGLCVIWYCRKKEDDPLAGYRDEKDRDQP